MEGLAQYGQRQTIRFSFPPIKKIHLRIAGVYTPIDAIKPTDLKRLDIEDCLKNINTNIRRLRCIDNNLKTLQEQAQIRPVDQMFQIKKYYMDGDKIVYGDAEPYTLNEVIDQINSTKDVAYHEVITRSDVRLFIDMDHTN